MEEEEAAAAGVSFSVAAVAPAAVVVVVSVSVSCSMGSGGGTALLLVSSCLSFLTAMESGDTIEEAEDCCWGTGAGPGGGAAAEDLLAEVVVVEVEAAGAATEDEGGGGGALEEDVDEDFDLVPAVVAAAGGCEEEVFAGDLAVLTSTTWLPSFRLASITLTISLVLVRTLSMLTITSLLFSPGLCSRPRCSCRMSRPRAAMASSSSPDSTTSVSSSQIPADNTSWILTRTEART